MSLDDIESEELTEIEEAEFTEETVCLNLEGDIVENINLVSERFNQSPQTIIEIAVKDPKKYSIMLEASRKLAK